GRGWRVEEGYNMDSVMLKPGDGGEWPSGQKAIPRFVVYALEGVRDVDVSRWRLVVRGRRGTVTLAYKDLADSSYSLGVETFHCVTGWSVKGVEWGGIRLGEILSRVDSMDGGWVVFKSIGGYTTVVPLPYASEGVIVTSINGRPLEARHGFPARFLNPRLYGWKSAKWLAEVEVRDEYVDGVWEALAYHERGLVAAEERFKIRNPEALEILD
ncbi:MAG: molybdopterin-dependent oxidoreductase, partial [Desulfurococcales archaeon]|nr:molybdopterin-dependent oxidoreductase [Desulfurococcales archaeon]